MFRCDNYMKQILLTAMVLLMVYEEGATVF